MQNSSNYSSAFESTRKITFETTEISFRKQAIDNIRIIKRFPLVKETSLSNYYTMTFNVPIRKLGHV